MPAIAATVLSIAADAFIGTLIGNLAADMYDKLKGDPTKKAYEQALGTAIQRYATGDRLALAQPLLDKKGILTDEEVATELAKLLHFEQAPDLVLIGEKWNAAFTDPPRVLDFTSEARLLVGYLEQELRNSDAFRPAFEAQDLNAVAVSAEQSAEVLANIETQLEGLTALLDAHFGSLAQAFSGASFNVRDQIRDYSRFIAEKTHGFVGRQWVFDAVEQFMDVHPRGYFFVLGDPGVGKSALAAQMVKQNGYVHHFNIRAEGINKAATFLKNVCAQLIAVYELEYTVLPPETTDDAGFLNQLLGEVSGKLEPGKRCVIVVDALDEVDTIGMPSGANLLYLPLTLPEDVYIVVTMRDVPDLMPRVTCEQDKLEIKHDSSDNIADVRDYVTASAARPGIQAYITTQDIEGALFVEHLVEKSQGNFMYLRYVLPEIERGVYRDLDLEAIPVGLQNYYEDHWRRMRGIDEDAWFDYKLPVIVALTVVREPVSLDLIRDFSKVDNRRRIRAVVREWAPFLHEEEIEYEGERQRRYRLYHASFFDFVASRQEVADERVDLQAMHAQIADKLWEDLFGVRQ